MGSFGSYFPLKCSVQVQSATVPPRPKQGLKTNLRNEKKQKQVMPEKKIEKNLFSFVNNFVRKNAADKLNVTRNERFKKRFLKIFYPIPYLHRF